MLARLLFLALLCILTLAVTEFDVHRMVQIDIDGEELGSRRTRVDFLASAPTDTDSLTRKAMVLQLRDLTVDLAVDFSARENVDALLVIVPNDGDAPEWHTTEAALMHTKINIPVYFAFDNEHTQSIYAETRSGNAVDGVQLAVADAEAPALAQPDLKNVLAMLPGGEAEEGLPTMLITAYYDASGIAPSLAVGADSNGSGVVALLELARMFARLYASTTTTKAYNLLFLLSAGGRLNFQGTRHWVNEATASVLDTIDFVLCLDSIGSSSELFLHATKAPKDEKAAAFHEALGSAATSMDASLEYVYKKINGSTDQLRWEHEVFAQRKIPAATLSSHSAASPQFQQGSILDRRVDEETLRRNIRVVGESVAHMLFDLPAEVKVFESSFSLSAEFVASWVKVMSTTSRAVGSMAAGMVDSLQAVFSDQGEGVFHISQQTFPLEAQYKLYGVTRTRMGAHRVKSMWFDLIIAVAIACYLVLLNFVLKGPSLFKLSTPSKRKKN